MTCTAAREYQCETLLKNNDSLLFMNQKSAFLVTQIMDIAIDHLFACAVTAAEVHPVLPG